MLRGLSVITSFGCNLKCEYCKIEQAKRNHKTHSKLQEENIQALKDGTFLKNIELDLTLLGENPITITDIAFWGQEPTLTLQYITENLEQWVDLFPNWRNTMFSTNGMANGEKIVDFVKKLDSVLKHNFSLEVQISYDGNESTQDIRKADSDKILNTASYILKELNKVNLKNVNMRIFLHGVVSLELLDRLDSFEKIYNYNKNLVDVIKVLKEINFNKKVEFLPGIGIGLEAPVDASTEYGLKLFNFIKQTKKIDKNLSYGVNGLTADSIVTHYSTGLVYIIDILKEFGIKDIDEFIHLINSDNRILQLKVNKALSNILWCGNAYSELKIMYDGTFVNCQNHIFDREVEYILKDNSIENSTKIGLATHNYYLNPLKEETTIEHTQQYFDLFKQTKETAFFFMFCGVVNTFYWLVKNHQVDESYNNVEKMLRHSFYITTINSCTYNNLMKTGTMYYRPTGFIRFLCNGTLDYIEERALKELNMCCNK